MPDISNVDEFIDLYTRLETDAKTIYGVYDGFIDWLAKKGGKARGPHSKYLKDKSNVLYCCKDVRNVIQHDQKFGGCPYSFVKPLELAFQHPQLTAQHMGPCHA